MNKNTDIRPILALLPYKLGGVNIAKCPASWLQWPTENHPPKNLSKKLIGELPSNIHILIQFPKKSLYLPSFNNINPVLSLYLSEPDALSKGHLRLLRFCAHKFYRILTINSELLRKKKNARFFVPAHASFDHHNVSLDQSRKTKNISLIASDKNSLEGHKLRHMVVNEVRNSPLEIDLMGRKYRPIKYTFEGLSKYRFSVIIENSKQTSYFTEKLIDAFICETVPIYWGAPNVGDYFDSRGIIQCASFREIIHSLKRISLDDYASRLEYIKKNQTIASRDYSSGDRPIKFLYSEIQKEF